MQALSAHLAGRARVAAVVAAGAALALLLLTIGSGAPASAAPTATASRSVTINIKDFKYKPPTIDINPGDRVVWVNLDKVKHTATKGGSFTTGKIKPGNAVAVRFSSKGTYRYHCTLHEDMFGKIVVG
jgi:plastocyanin